MSEVESIFQAKEVRSTPMRQLLLEYLLIENKTVGLSALENVFPKADRTTLYRTLKTFEEKGIIHAIENGTAEIKYALCSMSCSQNNHLEKHPHFHCLQCNEITCLEAVYIPQITLPAGYHTQEMSMMIKGICKLCA